jgi:hypothetical protein
MYIGAAQSRWCCAQFNGIHLETGVIMKYIEKGGAVQGSLDYFPGQVVVYIDC